MQLNKLISTQILPYATGDDEDKIRDLTQRSSIQMIFFHQRNALRKFYTKRSNSNTYLYLPQKHNSSELSTQKKSEILLCCSQVETWQDVGSKIYLPCRFYSRSQGFTADWGRAHDHGNHPIIHTKNASTHMHRHIHTHTHPHLYFGSCSDSLLSFIN